MGKDGGGDGESEDFLQGVAKVGLVSGDLWDIWSVWWPDKPKGNDKDFLITGDLWDIWSVWRPDKPKDNDKDETISNTESNDFLQVVPRVRWAVPIEHPPM